MCNLSKSPHEEAPELAELLMETAERLQQVASTGAIGKGGTDFWTYRHIEIITGQIIAKINELVPHISEIEEPVYDLALAVARMSENLYGVKHKKEG